MTLFRVLLAAAFVTQVTAVAAAVPAPSQESDGVEALWVEPVTGIELVYIPAGSFLMGTPEDEIGREPGEVLHRVTIPRPFYMGRFEITQAQWEDVTGRQPSQFSECGSNCPVENVSHRDVQDFLNRLHARSGEVFRLPTEAEWEYACRAGTTSAFSVGDRLSLADANFDARLEGEGAFRGSPAPVGTFAPNPWGLYDMHGNVWEWTADWYRPYGDRSTPNPAGHPSTWLKVIRGGSWYYGSDSARCGLRYTHRPQDSGPSLGFRVVREIPVGE